MNESQIQAYNEFSGIYGFIPTQSWRWVLNSPCKTTFLLYGNQKGKGEEMVMDWVLRMYGKHPQKQKNILPEDRFRTLRICCETLPQEKEGEEVNNTIYPVLKRRIPPSWLKGDITARKSVMKINSPFNASRSDTNLEFVSYGQGVQRQAGVQRRALMQDEEANKDFFEEQQARLLATGGDTLIGFTPVPGSIGWMFDDLYDRAKVIYRTPLVRERFKERFGEDYPEVHWTGKKDDVCVIMAATDDNPTYDLLAKTISEREGKSITAKEYLDDFFRDRYGDDQDVWDARRFGIFRQLSGKVHKAFSSLHIIDGLKYFPMGMPGDWFHFRLIDYHQKNPWAVVWGSRSPANEIFIWRDAAFVPGKMQTYDIVSSMIDMSGGLSFKRNMIDPLAEQTQLNTGFTTVDDLNRLFREFANEGRGSGGYWTTWDTKGTVGREEMTKRLLNSRKVGVPFNNTIQEDRRSVTLPTIWFLDDCRRTIEAMSKWRYEEWETRASEQRNDEKEKPQQKFSHFPIAIECGLKDPFISRPMIWDDVPFEREKKRYFQSANRH